LAGYSEAAAVFGVGREKSGFGGEHAASNHRLMYTCACASPQ
jgi:hypothetical protein